jgi:hypothetical protein
VLNVQGRQAFFRFGLVLTPNLLAFFNNSRSSQSIRASPGRSFGNRLTYFLIANHLLTQSSSIQANGRLWRFRSTASARHRTNQAECFRFNSGN